MMRWMRIAMVLVLAGIAPLAQAVDCIMHNPQVAHHHEMAMPVAQCFGATTAAVMADGVTTLIANHQPAPVMPVAVPGIWQHSFTPPVRREWWPPGRARFSAYNGDVINRTGRRRI